MEILAAAIVVAIGHAIVWAWRAFAWVMMLPFKIVWYVFSYGCKALVLAVKLIVRVPVLRWAAIGAGIVLILWLLIL